jgi:acyl carrier protein
VSDTRDKLLNYINGELLTDPTRRAAPDTPLFEDGWIDSLKILKLIAFVELMIGCNIPDEEIVMKNFRTVTMIVEHFESKN